MKTTEKMKPKGKRKRGIQITDTENERDNITTYSTNVKG